MSNPSQGKPALGSMEIGRLERPVNDTRLPLSDMIAIVVSLCWLALIGGFFLFTGQDGMSSGAIGTIMVLVAIFLPLALIWVAAVTARTARAMKAEAQRLQEAIDSMNLAWQASNGVARPSVEQKLAEIATSAKQTENAIATFTSRRDGDATQPSADRKAAFVPAPTVRPGEEQPTLALGTPAEDLASPVSVADFVLALNFPDSQDDRDGIRALRRTLDDRNLAKLIRAAQDVLTLLGQDGIFMDDLKPDRARTDVWRRFANGERGKSVAALGGVRDRSSLALTAARMRQDTIFRDASHHFLRQFDRTIAEFEKNASDQEMAELAETRTARAFMLLGRVTGTFD
ncbi:MAG: hypothetical protein WAT77_02245 [Paracoccaceae bacterium]